MANEENNPLPDGIEGILSLLSRELSRFEEKAIRDGGQNVAALGSDIRKEGRLPGLAHAFFGEEYDKEAALAALGLDDPNNAARKRLEAWLEDFLYVPDMSAQEPARAMSAQVPGRAPTASAAAGPAPDGAPMEDLQPLPDNILLATLIARRTAARLAPSALPDYLRRFVLPAMQGFREQGETPERVLDLFIEPAKGRLALSWRKHRAEALLRLAAYLETQPQRSRGFYGTYAQLATMLRADPGPKFLPVVAAIYHRVLIHPPSETGADVMAKAANNLTGRVMEALRSAFGGTDAGIAQKAPTATLRAANRIHTLAAICAAKHDEKAALLADETRRKRLRAALEVAGLHLPEEAPKASRKAAAWLMMTNVLGAWHGPDPDFFRDSGDSPLPERLDDAALAPLAFAGAMLRLELADEDERDEMGHAFANLSNMVGRGREGSAQATTEGSAQATTEGSAQATTEGSAQATTAAACIAATGLWQLALRGADEMEILGAYRGLDVAARLLARLDDLPPETHDALAGLPEALSWLAAAVGHMGTEGIKLALFFERAWVKKQLARGAAVRSRQGLVAALDKLAGGLAARLAGPGAAPPDPDAEEAIVAAARLCAFAMRNAVGEEKVQSNAGIIDRLVDRVAAAAEDADGAWMRLYGSEERLPGGAKDSPRAGVAGPLAALRGAEDKQLFSPEEWRHCNEIIENEDVDPVRAAHDFLAEEVPEDRGVAEAGSRPMAA